jgi:hypothetical protein
MVSGHANNNSNTDAYANVIQGKVLFYASQLPKLLWNQIKILILSNKDGTKTQTYSSYFYSCDLEFDIERDMLMTDTLPKLQQYFLTQGIYVSFIDCNLNWDLDLSRNPYHVLRYMKELHNAYRTSTGLFLLVR